MWKTKEASVLDLIVGLRPSTYLVRSFFLIIALAWIDPCCAQGGAVATAIRGPQAPALLGALLNTLADKHPDIVFSPLHLASEIAEVPAVCGAQEQNGVTRLCTFWDAMIARGAWPAEAPLLDKVKTHFATGKDYRLPNVVVSVGQSVVTATLIPAGLEPSSEEKKALCRRQRWRNSADVDCVLEEVPVFGANARVTRTRRLIVRQPVIRLVVPNVPGRSTEAVRNDLRAAIKAFVVAPGSSATVEDDLAPRTLFQASTAISCDDITLNRAAQTARKLINWPDTPPLVVAGPGAAAFVELDNSLFPSPRFQFSSDGQIPPDWPADAVSLLHHPAFLAPDWTLDCNATLSGTPAGHLSHTLAVASAMMGLGVKLRSSNGSTISLKPLLPSSPIQIDILHALYPAENQIIGDGPMSQVIVASVQTTPPKPPAAPTYRRDYKVLDYRSFARAWTTMGRILVAATPVYQLPNGASPDLDIDTTDNFVCVAWPGCLDSLGLTITVAAIDANGNIMRNEPGSGLLYELTPKTVSVAAPGENLPVIANGPSGPTIAFASGTSVAAPIVGALAMRMRSFAALSQPRAAYDVVAAIQATSDFSRNFGLLRYGIVNARRALAAAALPLRAAIAYGSTNDEQADADTPRGIFAEINGVLPTPDTCRIAVAQSNRGVLLYYTANSPPVSASGTANPPQCIAMSQMLRLRQTSNDGNRRRYALAYHDVKDGGDDTQYPRILRDIYLESPSSFATQCALALGSPGARGANQPCLTGENGSGHRVSIDLTDIDLVFQPSGWRERQ